MEILKKVIKEYGSAIGPVLAFVFGVVTILLKYRLDKYVEKSKVIKSFNILKKLIKDSKPPVSFFPKKSDGIIMHADEARNMTNIARFYNKLLAIKSIIENIDKNINESCDIKIIRQFHSIKWEFNILISDVEKARENRRIEVDSFVKITSRFDSLIEVIDDPKKFYDYIEHDSTKKGN